MESRTLITQPATLSTERISELLDEKSSEIIWYLAVDYDGCGVVYTLPNSIPNHREDFLSPALLTFMKTRNFKGFYGCTHRCLGTDFKNTWNKKRVDEIGDALKRPFDVRMLLTTYITNNLQKASGIPCIKVSTPDDDSNTACMQDVLNRCGYGYEHLITPYEQELLRLNKNYIYHNNKDSYANVSPLTPGQYKELYGDHSGVNGYDHNSKQIQLEQILAHASALHPGKNVRVCFVDNELKLCKKACDTVADNKTQEFLWADHLPRGTGIDSYLLDMSLDIPQKIGSINGNSLALQCKSLATARKYSQKLLNKLDNMNYSHAWEEAISIAAKENAWDVFELLLSKPNIREEIGFPLINEYIQDAILNLNLDAVRQSIQLLKRLNSFKLFARIHNDLLLDLAYKTNKYEIFQLLAKEGFAKSYHLENHLLRAAGTGNALEMQILIELMAFVPFDIDVKQPDTNQTAFTLAIGANRLDICKLLKDAGADVNYKPQPAPMVAKSICDIFRIR